MSERNVRLTEHCNNFIDAGIAAGHFSNASEAVMAGLHLLERQAAEDQAKTERLRAAAQEGVDELDRGKFTTLRSRAEVDSFVQSAGSDRR